MSISRKILSLCLESNISNHYEEENGGSPSLMLEELNQNTSEETYHLEVQKENNSAHLNTEVCSNLKQDSCLQPLFLTTDENCDDLNVNSTEGNVIASDSDCLSEQTHISNSPIECAKDVLISTPTEECSTDGEQTDDSVKDPNFENARKHRKRQIYPDRRQSTSSTASSSSSSSTTSSSSSSSSLSASSPSPATNDSQNQIIEDLQDPVPKQPARKKLRVVSQWKQNVVKSLRNSGQAYKTKTGRNIPAKTMKNGCGERCRLKCSSFLTNQKRESLFGSFWALKCLEKQRQYIHRHIKKVEVKYRYVNAHKPRKNNIAFYFEIDGALKRVCKTMFKATLDINDRTIRTVTEKSHDGFLEDDLRGKHGKHFTVSESIKNDIRNHIKGIPRIESHYLRAQTSREYIDGGKTITDLHRDYVNQCKENGRDYGNYVMYSRIFNHEFNIGFFVPKKDRCELCVAYENSDVNNKITLQEKYDVHQIEKKMSREEKRKDKENLNTNKNLVVAVYDLQAVLQLPRGDVSVFYYKSKLNNFNFSVSKLKPEEKKGKRKKNTNNDNCDTSGSVVDNSSTDCYFWHEGEGKRGADDIGSCLLKFIENELKNHSGDDLIDIIFFSDNCCGQNKNKYIVGLYMYAVMKYPKLNSITHKYLITGHTQNEGDSVHSVIEKQIKRSLKSGPIYVPSQYVQIIKEAKKTKEPFKVNELTHRDFISTRDLINDMGLTSLGKVKISDVKMMAIYSEKPNILKYKTSYSEMEWLELNLLGRKKNLTIPDIKRAYMSKLEIKDNKKTGFLTLLANNHIPSFYSDFYRNL